MSQERTYFINGLPSLYEALKRVGREEGKRTLEDFLAKSFHSDLSEKIERFPKTGINPRAPLHQTYGAFNITLFKNKVY